MSAPGSNSQYPQVHFLLSSLQDAPFSKTATTTKSHLGEQQSRPQHWFAVRMPVSGHKAQWSEGKREKEDTTEGTLFWISKIVFTWPFGFTWLCVMKDSVLPDGTTNLCVHYQHFTLRAVVSPWLHGCDSALRRHHVTLTCKLDKMNQWFSELVRFGSRSRKISSVCCIKTTPGSL